MNCYCHVILGFTSAKSYILNNRICSLNCQQIDARFNYIIMGWSDMDSDTCLSSVTLHVPT